MTPRRTRLDLRLRPGNLWAVWGLCLLAAGLAAASIGSLRPYDPKAADPQRVALAEERIDPNTASIASLRRLPGIGPVRAEAVVAYRRSRGGRPFQTANDLTNVKGIGALTVERFERLLALPANP